MLHLELELTQYKNQTALEFHETSIAASRLSARSGIGLAEVSLYLSRTFAIHAARLSGAPPIFFSVLLREPVMETVMVGEIEVKITWI